MKILDTIPAYLVLIIVLAVAAVIAIIAWGIHRYTHPKLKNDPNKPTEEEIVKETMERYCKPIEDEEVAKKIEDYKQDE